MRGEVEIWQGDDLILRESNLITDGAGELLADIMTVTPSLSSIEDQATSSILDASNYMIQAISFSTGKDGFLNNGHNYSDDKLGKLALIYFNETKDSVNNYCLVVPGVANDQDYTQTPPYYPKVGLPNYPDPALTVLQTDTSVSGKFDDSLQSKYDISSFFPGNGQHLNFMPQSIASSIRLSTPELSSFGTTDLLKRYLDGQIASFLGAFPDGSSSPHNTYVSGFQSTGFSVGDYGSEVFGYFNEVSSMDISGFVNMVMSSVPGPNYDMSSPASGLVMSANSEFSSNGIIEYSVAFARGDMHTVNHYGGVYSMGLWSIDMSKSLLNGNTPPYSFDVLNNPRKYKLFCRKDFTKNITENNSTNTALGVGVPFTIKWRLHLL